MTSWMHQVQGSRVPLPRARTAGRCGSPWAALLIVGLALFGCGSADPAPVAPADPDGLDGRVRRLVEEHLAAARAAPGDARAHATLGLVYESNELWAEARDAFANAASLAPDEVAWRHHEAIARRALGDVEGARALLSEAASERPDAAPIQHRLGEALFESGDPEGALVHFEQAAALTPERPEGLVGMGATLLQLGRVEEALSILERAVALDPDYRHAHYLLGLAYRDTGRTHDAEVELARGVDGKARAIPDELEREKLRYATSVSARLERAILHIEGGRLDRAQRILERLRKTNPEHPMILNNLAVTYLRLGDPEGALELLGEAGRVDPDRPLTHVNRSACLIELGMLHRALSEADRAVELEPRIGLAHSARGRALILAGRLEEAHAAYRAALDLDPSDIEAARNLADVGRELGRDAEALDLYAGIVKTRPDDRAAWLALASLALDAGDLERARVALGSARRIAPEDAETLALTQRLREVRKP